MFTKFGIKEKTIGWLGFIPFIMWMYSGFLYNNFAFSPEVPDLKTGKIIAFDFKSKMVYLSQVEIDKYHFYLYGGEIGIVLYVILFKYFEFKNKERN